MKTSRVNDTGTGLDAPLVDVVYNLSKQRIPLKSLLFAYLELELLICPLFRIWHLQTGSL